MGEANVEQHIIADKTLIRTAQITSWILTPFSIPFLAFLVLFLFSYLRIMPLQYKLIDDAQAEYSLVYDWYYTVCTGGSDYLYHCKSEMETQ